VFAQMRRELEEELSLRPNELGAIHLIGLVEDDRLRQPELVFDVPCLLTRRQIEVRLDESEHAGVLAIAADSAAVAAALNDPLLTPVAAGTLSLWRERYTRGPGSADVSYA